MTIRKPGEYSHANQYIHMYASLALRTSDQTRAARARDAQLTTYAHRRCQSVIFGEPKMDDVTEEELHRNLLAASARGHVQRARA